MNAQSYATEHQLIHSTLVLGAVVEARDAYTGGHLWRVAQYAKLLGQAIGMGRQDLYKLTLGGYVHDLGKVGIPDEILGKRGPLSDDEFEVVKTHPLIGSDIVSSHPLGDLLDDIVRHHHERNDGGGYPDGLSGSAISVHAAIISVADVFDALTSSRSYRNGMPADKAMDVLEKGRESHHPPMLLDAFGAIVRSGRLDVILSHSSDNRALITCARCGPIIVMPNDPEVGDTTSCPSCHGEYCVVSSDRDEIIVEETGNRVDARRARPRADLTGIEETIATLA